MLAACAAFAQTNVSVPLPLPSLQVNRTSTGEVYVSPDVNCHQGYATDGTNHYTFDTQRIEKRLADANWTCVLSNTAPLAGIPGVNHLGDGAYYNGRIYIVAENWGGCGNYHYQNILVFDSDTLARLEVHDVSAQGNEVSGLVVVPDQGTNGIIYVTSYCDGSKIFKYDLATFAYLGNLPLRKPIPWLQGIAYHDGMFYAPCDIDGLYSIDQSGNVNLVYLSHLPGNHEGLDYSQNELRWLIDSGNGNKHVHYIDIGSVSVTWPGAAAGWILESTTNLFDPAAWTPVSYPINTNSIGTNAAQTSFADPAPGGTRFYRLRKP